MCNRRQPTSWESPGNEVDRGVTKLKTFQGRNIKASENQFFEENMKNLEKRLLNRGCPTIVVEKHHSEVKFSHRTSSLKPENRDAVQEYCPL